MILWDVASREPIGEPLTAHQGTVNSVAFSPDGKTLASASFDYSVILWSLASGHPLGESLTGAPFPAQSVAFSPSGETLASASADKADKTVILWNVASRTRLGEPFKGQRVSCAEPRLQPDGKMLASSSEDWTVIPWDVAQTAGRALLARRLECRGERGLQPRRQDPRFREHERNGILWDVASRKPLGDPIDGHHSYVESVAFHPDGKTLASGGWDGTVALWDVASRKPLGDPIKAHRFGVRSVAFSPDERPSRRRARMGPLRFGTR